MSALTHCRFCKFERLDAQATWCPCCGLINPVASKLGKSLPLVSVDTVQSPDGGRHKFFVCQNSACNWPVMSPEEVAKQQSDITHQIANHFKSQNLWFSWLLEGVKFFLLGRPNEALQRSATANWHTAFRCPNCRRPVFYRKSLKNMLPEEVTSTKFIEFFGRITARIIALVALFLFVVMPFVLNFQLIMSGPIGWLFSLLTIEITFVTIVLTLTITGAAGFRLSCLTAFSRAQDM